MNSAPLRIGVLASGEGTTLQAILDACGARELNAQVAVVISNNRDSGALRRAKNMGVKAVHLSALTHPDPDKLDRAVLSELSAGKVGLVVLAGYMKKVGPMTLAAYEGRMVNTHPGLLPKYGGQGMFGQRVHEAVLAAKEKETGVTVHLVDAEYDHGKILGQVKVPVQPGDDARTLAARVQAAERPFLVEVLRRFAK